MKISYNWLKQFLDINKTPDELSLILTNIGLEVESVDKVESIRGGLDGLTIGHVTTCVQHPNADRLKVTRVDIGGAEDIQIVCGANNVAAGQKVVVAPVNTTIYPTAGEPFKINKSKIRGEVSEGMICAEDEIGLGTNHDGIIILDENAQIGSEAKSYFNIEDDYVFEIGLTPNRADAASHLGVARDLAAYLKLNLIFPDVSGFKTADETLMIPVFIEDEAACPRYSSVTISGVAVGESPDWLRNRLNAIGIRPINNIVDITNYVLHDLGQPLHAFDADEIKGNKVYVRKCAEGTPFVTLDGIERKLSADDLMICNETEPMCIAGVFGGATSGVKNSTKNIFLESAFFNAVSVRKTSKRFGLKTDASFRFERGTDPEMTVAALKRAALLITEIAGGVISSEVSDLYASPSGPFEVKIRFNTVNRLIGKEISIQEIRATLTGLGIQIVSETTEGMELLVPSYKVDVTREVDIIEEILRIHGYDNVAIPNQIKASLNPGMKPERETVQDQIAELLTANGFMEILTNSLTSLKYSLEPESAVRILNPLSSDLDVMRQSLLSTGLESVLYNLNRKVTDILFYEFGKVYALKEGSYKENQRLALFLTGNFAEANWDQKPTSINFSNVKSVVDLVLKRLNIVGLNIGASNKAIFSQGSTYLKGDKELVSFGQISSAAAAKMDINVPVFYADFDWDLVLRSIRNNKIVYKEISRFPAVRRDLSMLLDEQVSFGELKNIAHKTEKTLLKEVSIFDVYTGDKLPEGKKSYALSFTLQDDEKTLTDKQIDSVMQKLIYNFEKQTGAEIRR